MQPLLIIGNKGYRTTWPPHRQRPRVSGGLIGVLVGGLSGAAVGFLIGFAVAWIIWSR